MIHPYAGLIYESIFFCLNDPPQRLLLNKSFDSLLSANISTEPIFTFYFLFRCWGAVGIKNYDDTSIDQEYKILHKKQIALLLQLKFFSSCIEMEALVEPQKIKF
jgi:hypothetical protein